MHRSLSTRNRVGLVLATLLALVDVVPLGTSVGADGQVGPPIEVLVFCGVMGVVTLGAVAVAWARRSRAALRVAALARVLSAATALPAFFVEGVPAQLVVWAALAIVVTLVAVWLLLARPPAATATAAATARPA